MQNEKSQLQNREAGARVLRARLLAQAQEEADKEAADAGRSPGPYGRPQRAGPDVQLPGDRISDHRVGFKAYNLDQVLDGGLDDVIAALEKAGHGRRCRRLRSRMIDAAAATRRPGPAGGASPRHDAEELAAHVLGLPGSRLVLLDRLPAGAAGRYAALVEQRAARGAAAAPDRGWAGFRRLDLAVGPRLCSCPGRRPGAGGTGCWLGCGPGAWSLGTCAQGSASDRAGPSPDGRAGGSPHAQRSSGRRKQTR